MNVFLKKFEKLEVSIQQSRDIIPLWLIVISKQAYNSNN